MESHQASATSEEKLLVRGNNNPNPSRNGFYSKCDSCASFELTYEHHSIITFLLTEFLNKAMEDLRRKIVFSMS